MFVGEGLATDAEISSAEYCLFSWCLTVLLLALGRVDGIQSITWI
jgi:hypothetical protein